MKTRVSCWKTSPCILMPLTTRPGFLPLCDSYCSIDIISPFSFSIIFTGSLSFACLW